MQSTRTNLLLNRIEIKQVTQEEAEQIIETRKPIGSFFCIENGIYVGISNETGDAWTEDFKTETACRRWLRKR